MLSTRTFLVLLPVAIATVSAAICPRGKQYLDHDLQKCVNCTACNSSNGMVVLRPCEVHQDTVCGPLSELKKIIRSEMPHRHRHGHNNRERNGNRNEGSDEADAADEEVAQAQVSAKEAPLSKFETIIWDWQAIVISLAVLSCIVFFLVITIYSLHQARQWRRLKENFEADVEELSVRLSLMAASCVEKGEVLEPNFSNDVRDIRDGNYHNNKCVYLEQLLNVRKDQKSGAAKTGNVYIEDANAPSVNGKT